MTELLLGAMPLPEPMLTKMLDSILSHQAIMRGGYMKQNIAMHGMLVIRYASPFTKNQFFWLYSGTLYNTLFKTFRYIHFYYCYCYRWYCYIIIISPESKGSVDIWFHVKGDRVINGVNSITQKATAWIVLNFGTPTGSDSAPIWQTFQDRRSTFNCIASEKVINLTTLHIFIREHTFQWNLWNSV